MKKSLLALLPLIGLTSCGSNIFSIFEGKINNSPFVDKEYDGYRQVSSFSKLKSKDQELETNTLSSLFTFPSFKVMPSLGENRLLVVPVSFASKVEDEENKLDLIKKAFFGDKSNNQFYSVSEYYYKSSNSRFLLKGDVTSFYKSSFSLEEISSIYGISKTKSTLTSIYNDAKQWLKESNSSLYDSYFSTYGEYIPIYFIYDAPYSGLDGGVADRKSMMWAFTINDPAPICWSSFYMGYPNDGKMDSHTYIHETGHLFGLPDYYDSYSSISNQISPLGRMDMMDCSLGDHNCFSKTLLGWSSPYFVTSSCKIKLHQGSGNNECIIIPIESNFNPYGRYVMLEYYSPTYLNYVDALQRKDNSLSLFSKPGIRAYLVDSRLAAYEGISKKGIVDENMITTNRRLTFENDNSSSSPYLIQNIDKGLNSTELPSFYYASNMNKVVNENGNLINYSSTLFYEGEGITSSFKGLEELKYNFKVDKLTSSYASISIEAR